LIGDEEWELNDMCERIHELGKQWMETDDGSDLEKKLELEMHEHARSCEACITFDVLLRLR
jgi:hypothetical protein